MDFIVIVEIWLDNKIQYISIMINGYVPTQEDIETREAILDMLAKVYTDYKILDLVGIVHEGETLWRD